jgi:hypothetical protein
MTMSSQPRSFVWQMIREAVEALGGSTANVAVRDWILERYPGTNPPPSRLRSSSAR